MNTKEYGVSLMELFGILMKRIHIIIVTVVGCVVVMEAVTFWGATYQSTAIMVIEPSTSSLSTTTEARGNANSLIGSELTMEQNVQNNDVNYRLTTGAKIASVCSAVMKSDMILQPIVEELNLQCSAEALADNIDVESIENSQMLQITVRASNGEEAKKICEHLIKNSEDMILKLTDAGSYEEVYAPQSSTKPISSGKMKSAIIGLLLGVVLSVAGIIVMNMLDDHVRTEKAIVYDLGMNVLGVIPVETKGKSKR